MNAQDCLDMLRQIKDVTFSSVDESGLPHARIIDVMLVENERLFFCTARGKDFYREITANPNIAVTCLNKVWQTVRLEGKAILLDDKKKWIDRIFEENPSMNGVYPGESRYILDPFVIESGNIELFDLAKSPIEREYFSFGNDAPKKKGFFISDDCIGCGTCQSICPQKAIDDGMPYTIRQNNCLHCGLCYEKCPTGCIEKR